MIICSCATAAAEPDTAAADAVAARRACAEAIERATDGGDARTLAWAIYRAEGQRDDAVEAALRRALPVARALPVKDARRVILDRILDLLIRWKAPIPAEDLDPLLDDRAFREPAIVLACLDPEANEPSLRRLLAIPSWDTTWVATADALASVHSPMLAGSMMRSLTVELRLQVHDPGSMGGSARASSRFGDGGLAVPQGFPPDAVYRLRFDPKPGDLVVATGPLTVYAKRDEFTEGIHGTGGSSSPIDRDALRVEFLAQLLGVAVDQLPIQAHVRKPIEWSDSAAFSSQAAAARAGAEQDWKRLLDLLVEKRLLEPSETAGIPPTIRTVVEDFRHDKSVALPALVDPAPAVPRDAAP